MKESLEAVVVNLLIEIKQELVKLNASRQTEEVEKEEVRDYGQKTSRFAPLSKVIRKKEK